MFRMTRLIAPILLISMAIGIGGCSSCTDGGGLKKFPTVKIVSPADGFQLTRASDTDSDFTNGLQMRVIVRTTALAAGERIKLSAVSSADRSISAEATGELVIVEGETNTAEVTFQEFTPPVGSVALTASFSFSATAKIEDTINIKVETISLPTLSIISPQDSARLTAEDDNDGDLFNGFTTDVTVSAQNVQQGQTVELKVDGQVVGNSQVSANGAATFSNVALPEAPEPPGVTIQASTTNQEGDEASATIRVLVDTGRCIVVLTPQPGDGACDYTAGDDEAPDDPTWVERTFTVESNCDTVSLTINGAQHGEAKPVVDGEVTFLVPLEQVDGVAGQYDPRPTNELRVTAEAEDGRFGSTPPASYVADTLPPILTVVAPEGNGPDGALISIDDIDEGTDGLQFDVTGTVCQAPGDTPITVSITDDAGGEIATALASVLPDVVDGCRNWRAGLTLVAPGQLTVTASAADGCGNSGSAQDTMAADFVVPTLAITAPADGRIYLSGDDLDGDNGNGVQAVFTVESTGLTEGKTVFVERAAVSAAGQVSPFAAFPDDASGVVGAGDDPLATAMTGTLAAGQWRIRARYSGANPATSAQIGVRVVLTTPTIAIAAQPARTGLAALQICVTATDVQPGQPVTLSVNGGDLPATVDLAPDLGACFEGVALADGDNVLVARVADDAGQEAVSEAVTVHADRTPPQLVFTRPHPAAPNLSGDDDQDGDPSNGFQYDIRLDALDADPSVTVQLTARGVTYDNPAVAGNTYTFAAVRLAGGDNALSAIASDSVGNTAPAALVVNVDIVEPDTDFVTPRHGDCFADGANVAVVIESEVADNTNAIVTVNGADQNPTPIVNGRASFNLPLPDNQNSTLLGRVVPGDGPPGFTAEITVTVKSLAPVLGFDDPGVGATINLNSPDDGQGVAGFQEDVRVTAAELSPNQGATLTVNCGGGDVEYQAAAAVGGAFTFADVLIPDGVEGQCTASVTSTDCAGNTTTEQTTWILDRVAPTLVLEGISNGDRLGSAHDLNPAADGIQRTIVCNVSGIQAGADVTLTMGDDDPLVRQAPASGRTVFSGVTLPEGAAVPITCSASDANGNVGTVQVVVTVVAGEIELVWISPGGNVNWGVANDTAPGQAGFQGRFNLGVTEMDDGGQVRLCSNNHGGAGDACSRGEAGEFRVLAVASVAADRVLFSAAPMREGNHTIYAEPIIEGAVELPASPDRTIFVDSERPVVANLTMPSGAHNDGVLNIADDEDVDTAGIQATLQVTLGQGAGSAADGSPVRIVTSFPNPEDPSELGTGQIQGGGAQVTVTFIGGAAANAVHDSIYAIVTDGVGNQSLSPAADPRNVGLQALTVDNVAPTLTINKPSEGEVLNSEDDLDAAAGLQYAARFVVGGAASLAVQVDGADDDDSPVVGASGTVDVTVSFGGAQGDAHVLTATATDVAGNTTQRTVNVTAAPERPAISITSPAADAVFGEADDLDGAAGQIQIDVTISVDAGLAGRTVTVSSDLAGARVDDGAVAVAGDGTATIRVSLNPGVHNLTATITDTFGNPGVSEAVSVIVQAVGCGLVIASPAGSPASVNSTSITVQVTSAVAECDGEEVRVFVDNAVVAAGTGDLAAGTVTIADVDLGDGDGNRTLTAVVVQNEGEGNESTSTTSKTVQVDIEAPTVAFTNPAPPQGGGALQFAADVDPAAGLQRDFTFSVTGAVGATLILSSDVAGQLGQLANLSDAGSQNLNDITVPDGTHTLTVTVTDPAGNDGTASQDAVVDTVPPGTPDDVTLTVTDLRRLALTLDWTATGDDGDAGGAVAAIQVRYSPNAIADDDDFETACDAAIAPVPAAPDAAQQATLAGPGPAGLCRLRTGATAAGGTYYFAVRVVDDLGNASAVVAVDADAQTAGTNPVVSVYSQTDVPAPNGVTAWGRRVRALGDVNNDGFADIGASIDTENKAFIVYGAANPANATVQDISQANPNNLGTDIGGVGDVNGDGIDDLAMMDLYTMWIFLGVDGGQVNAVPSATFGLETIGGGDIMTALDRAGNFDGDTVGDPEVALNDILLSGPTQAGAAGGVFIILGRQAWPGGRVVLGLTDADDADNLANGVVRFVGNEAGTFLGYQLCYAGSGGPLVDHDADAGTPAVPDAFGDVIAGTNFVGGGTGVAYLIRGRTLASINGHLSIGSANVQRIDPILDDTAGAFGARCRGGVDLNGDGIEDFTVSAEVHQRVEVFSGADGSHLQTTTGPVGYGTAVGLGDVDNDGVADMFVSSKPDGSGSAQLHLRSDGALLAGDPVFTGANLFAASSDIAGDFTNDGSSDVVLGSENENRVVILH